MGGLADSLKQMKQESQMKRAGDRVLGVLASGGVEALVADGARPLYGIFREEGLSPEHAIQTWKMLEASGAARKANQEYLTEVEQTRTVRTLGDQREAVTGKTMAETQTENELRPWKVRSEEKLGDQRESAVRLNDANTNQVNTLTPVKVREGESRIAVNGSAANLNNTRAGDIIAKQPGEIAATAARARQSNAAAEQNEAGGKANHVGQFLQSVGVKPGTMVSNVKDGSVNFTEKYVTGRQARDIMAAAKQQGIAIEGQGVWDKAGNLTGFYMTSAVYDPATAERQRLVTKRPKPGAAKPQTARPAAPQAKPKPARKAAASTMDVSKMTDEQLRAIANGNF